MNFYNYMLTIQTETMKTAIKKGLEIRCMEDKDNKRMLIADEPTVKVLTKEQYDAAVMRVLSNLRTRAYSAGPFGIADEGMFLLFEALMKCLLKEELFGGRENEETNHSRVC